MELRFRKGVESREDGTLQDDGGVSVDVKYARQSQELKLPKSSKMGNDWLLPGCSTLGNSG